MMPSLRVRETELTADITAKPRARGALGRAVMRVYLNLLYVPPSPATALFDATQRAGAAMDLAMRIRRHGQVSHQELAAFARLGGTLESSLRLWLLPALESAHIVQVLRDERGEAVGVEEQVGVPEPVLEQAARVWRAFGPAPAEHCAVLAADYLAYAPYTDSDFRGLLEAEGFPARDHPPVLRSLEAVGMARRQRSLSLREDVYYSPYVWGTEAVQIAEFLHRMPPNEREVLGDIARRAAERPGSAVEDFSAGPEVVAAARKVGLIDATRVLTSGGLERSFAFSASLERQLTLGATDVTHERKQFVAHILYGHRFGFGPTGRIADPVVLVRALIDRGRVGPATAIGTDYPLLEASGIVRVTRPQGSTRAYLELVKHDVAEDSLELIRLAIGDETLNAGENPIRSLWVPGTFSSPERDRRELPELQPSAEAEVIGSVVERLREETARRMRQEDI